MTRKKSAIVGLRVRFRESLRKKLELAAKKKGVSLNAELIERLEDSFYLDEELPTMLEKMDNMEKMFKAYLKERDGKRDMDK
jgi:hypothetical protein